MRFVFLFLITLCLYSYSFASLPSPKGSAAFNSYSPSIPESVNSGTGSFNFNPSLISLKGITKHIPFELKLNFSSGTQGMLGLPQGWSFLISYINTDEKTLILNGSSFVIDPLWKSNTGYATGLKYNNDESIQFIQRDGTLPSMGNTSYHWIVKKTDGSSYYFDRLGKLKVYSDGFGNNIQYYYNNENKGVNGNYLSYIKDSFGQEVRLSYTSNSITVHSPDLTFSSKIYFDDLGVKQIIDPEGHMIKLSYTKISNTPLISIINYPFGLDTVLHYGEISYKDCDSGATKSYPSVSSIVHSSSQSGIIDKKIYNYNVISGYTYTGYGAGYCLGNNNDGLMNSGDQVYRYVTQVQTYNGSLVLKKMQETAYNSLHMVMEEKDYLISNGTIDGYFLTKNIYSKNLFLKDKHAQEPWFSNPVEVSKSYFNSENIETKLTKNSQSYTNQNNPIQQIKYIYDNNQERLLLSKKYQYQNTLYGGEVIQQVSVVANEADKNIFIEGVLSENKQYLDQINIKYQESNNEECSFTSEDKCAWKNINVKRDNKGRLTEKQVQWDTLPEYDTNEDFTRYYQYQYDGPFYTIKTSLAPANQKGEFDAFSEFKYDISQNNGVLVKSTSPEGYSSTYQYNKIGMPVKITKPLIDENIPRTYQITYNISSSGDNQIYVERINDGYKKSIQLDAQAHPIKIKDNMDYVNDRFIDDPNMVLLSNKYDIFGNVIESTDRYGLTTNYEYDSIGKLISSTSPLVNKIETEIDYGNLLVEKKVNNILYSNTKFMSNGKPIKTTQFCDTSITPDCVARTQDYEYDGFGRVIKTTQNKGTAFEVVTDNKYDIMGKVIETVFTGYDGLIKTDRNQYNLVEKLITSNTTIDSETVYRDIYTYNEKSQLLSRRSHDLNSEVKWEEKYAYTLDGLVDEVTRNDGTILSRNFYPNGSTRNLSINNVESKVFIYGNEQGYLGKITNKKDETTVNYTYFKNGTMKSREYSNGKSISVTKDSYGRVNKVIYDNGYKKIEYNDLNQVIKTTYCIDDSCEDSVNYTYYTSTDENDAPFKIKGITKETRLNGSVSYTLKNILDGSAQVVKNVYQYGQKEFINTYQYDLNGRLLEMKKNGGSETTQEKYTYDSLNRLISFNDQVYTYDVNGNLLSDGKNSYTYNQLDQLSNLTYDKNGRLISDADGSSYTYDELDKLLSYTNGNDAVTYSYYPDGKLATRTENNNTAIYNYEQSQIQQIITGGVTNHFYISGGKRFLGYANKNPFAYLGSNTNTGAILDNEALNTIDYDPYGEQTSENEEINSVGLNFTWHGEYRDPSNQLTYLRARFYNPRLHSFMTMDSYPVPNKYNFGNADPINNIDPTGHSAKSVIGIISGALMVATGAWLMVTGNEEGEIIGRKGLKMSVHAALVLGGATQMASSSISKSHQHASKVLGKVSKGFLLYSFFAGVGEWVSRPENYSRIRRIFRVDPKPSTGNAHALDAIAAQTKPSLYEAQTNLSTSIRIQEVNPLDQYSNVIRSAVDDEQDVFTVDKHRKPSSLQTSSYDTSDSSTFIDLESDLTQGAESVISDDEAAYRGAAERYAELKRLYEERFGEVYDHQPQISTRITTMSQEHAQSVDENAGILDDL